MIDLKYTITKFDDTTKTLTVTFGDGSWADIRLSNPLPKSIDELEVVIRQFSAPLEAIQAQTSPDADLSYISQLVGTERTTSRLKLTADTEKQIDPEAEAQLAAWEAAAFQTKVAEVLTKLGVIIPAGA